MNRVWEIVEGEAKYPKYGRKMGRRDEVEEAYECGFEEGYEAAKEEMYSERSSFRGARMSKKYY
jgi:flagellar biosynthesis/type III secretory pathway protein FliH